MNSFVFVTLFSLLAGAVLVQGDAVSSSNFGAGDISGHLKNKDYIAKQLNCVLGKGKCDNVGNHLKVAIHEVLTNNCKKCSKQQAANAKRVIAFMKADYPAEWNKVVAKYKQ